MDTYFIFTILVLLLISIGLLCIKYLNLRKQSSSYPNYSIDPESMKSDFGIIIKILDNYIIRELYRIMNTDHDFTENSSIKHLSANDYKNTIKCLIQPTVYISEDVSFFSSFCIKVYLNFIAETSEIVKQLFYKYYSGYNIDNYNKKGIDRSMIYFINEYIRGYIWKLSMENMETELKLIKNNTTDSSFVVESYTEQMSDYNISKYQELCKRYFDIYNINI